MGLAPKEVKELLIANADELREALVDQGLKLEKIDVQYRIHRNIPMRILPKSS